MPLPHDLPPTSRTVLVVERDLATRTALDRMVRALGYESRAVGDAREALRIVFAFPERVRLLLTDLWPAGMDGGELAERAREIAPRLRVVLMAGPASDSEAELLAAYPELPRVEKPIGIELLRSVLRAGLGPPEAPDLPRRSGEVRRRRERQSDR
jgi:DNA-binding NtrC family response regulator